MTTEPIAYRVGDATVRIDDVEDVGASNVAVENVIASMRVYSFRVTQRGVTTVYRCRVMLSDVMRLSDQQLAEHLLLHGRKKRRFGFRGPHIP